MAADGGASGPAGETVTAPVGGEADAASRPGDGAGDGAGSNPGGGVGEIAAFDGLEASGLGGGVGASIPGGNASLATTKPATCEAGHQPGHVA